MKTLGADELPCRVPVAFFSQDKQEAKQKQGAHKGEESAAGVAPVVSRDEAHGPTITQ